METIGRIRREHFVKGKSIKAIVRELKVSRNTVRKVLRSGATAFEYGRQVQPQPKLGPWRDDLDRMLAVNEAKPGRERLTLIRVYEELCGLGYRGSYDAVGAMPGHTGIPSWPTARSGKPLSVEVWN